MCLYLHNFSQVRVCIDLSISGVRYFIRGVDDDGNVANYVETEQMMIYCDYRASFVQVASYHSYMYIVWANYVGKLE